MSIKLNKNVFDFKPKNILHNLKTLFLFNQVHYFNLNKFEYHIYNDVLTLNNCKDTMKQNKYLLNVTFKLNS